MSSLYAAYVLEREGNHVLENEHGFIEYAINADVCEIHTVYVVPERRRSGRGHELMSQLMALAKARGANRFASHVWIKTLNATEALQAQVAYGFRVVGAVDDCIFLTKEFGG